MNSETETIMKELILKHHSSFFKWNEIDTSYIRKGIDSVVFSKDKKTFVVVYYEKFVGWVESEYFVEDVVEWFEGVV